MTHSLKCPSCGAPLQVETGAATMRCHFCGNSVIVPEELREDSRTPQQQQSSIPILGNILGQADKFRQLGELVRSGNKIAAIKLYRELFGTNLRDAKEAIERLERGQSVEVMHAAGGAYNNVEINPAQFTPPQFPVAPDTFQKVRAPRASGCRPLLIVLVIVVIAGLGIGLAIMFAVVRKSSDSFIPTALDPKSKGKTSSTPAGMASVALEFGSEGIGPGQFKDARSIGVDGEGRIYVAEYIGGRVQVFDRDGKFLAQWMVDRKMPLRGMAVDRKGTVFIVQKGEITRYEGLTGNSLGALSYNRYRGGNNFDDVTATQEGGLVASSRGSADNIVLFNSSGQAVKTIESAISGQTERSELDMRMATDGLGQIYALGTFNSAVFKFTREGKFITRIGGAGDEPGLFRAPGAVAVDGQGRVFVSDSKGVQVFDTNGRYIGVFRVEGGYPSGLVFNDRNELLVIARTKVVKFTIAK